MIFSYLYIILSNKILLNDILTNKKKELIEKDYILIIKRIISVGFIVAGAIGIEKYLKLYIEHITNNIAKKTYS